MPGPGTPCPHVELEGGVVGEDFQFLPLRHPANLGCEIDDRLGTQRSARIQRSLPGRTHRNIQASHSAGWKGATRSWRSPPPWNSRTVTSGSRLPSL